MTTDIEFLDLFSTAISTIRHYRDIDHAVLTGQIEFTENTPWVTGQKLLTEAKAADEYLPVLLADATSEQLGIMAWGVANLIKVSGNQTTIRLENVQAIAARPVIDSLLSQSTGEFLSPDDQRNYRIVETPAFLFEEPSTFLLTWNPAKQIPMQEFINIRESLHQGETADWDWTCRSHNKVKAGDRFFMLRQGSAPRGIVGSGWIRSYGWEHKEGGHYVDITWEAVTDPHRPFDPRTIAGAEDFHWTPQGSGIELDPAISDAVWKAWESHLQNDPYYVREEDDAGMKLSNTKSGNLDEEMVVAVDEDPASSLEGRLIETWSTRRERNPKNRALCLAIHEPRCAVCAMNFLEEYGEIGRDFIHVHHERPLGSADIDGALQDPGKDLKPVCPNCYAMLHRGLNAAKGEVRSIAELREIRARVRCS
jgi:5-methylcytosine-specific restriction protein A